jgi:AAA domain
VKQDANTILRDQGVERLRAVFDEAPAVASRGSADKPSNGGQLPRFKPVALDDVQISAEPPWLIRGLLPARGLVCIVGPPKSGKSFLTTDMLCTSARGALYAGRETTAGAVAYLTGEGVNGFKVRLVALRQHLGIEGRGTPFFMIENVPDLGSEHTDLPELIRELDGLVKAHAPGGLKAIVLDTLARCMGEADENSARDMGRFINRCSMLERHYKCVIVVVHHVGKDASRGGRGSNALNGAADVTMIVEKTDAFSKVRIDEMKDGREGQEWRFRLIPYALTESLDTPSESCSESSTCVVELLSEPSQAKVAASKTKKPPSGVSGDLLKVIRRAIEEAGSTNVESLAVPNNVRAVSRPDLKRYCETMAWQDQKGKPDNFRAMLSDNLSRLRAGDLIGFDRTWVWLT